MKDSTKMEMIMELVAHEIPDLLILYGASTIAHTMGLKNTDGGYPINDFIQAIESILDVQGVKYGKYEGTD